MLEGTASKLAMAVESFRNICCSVVLPIRSSLMHNIEHENAQCMYAPTQREMFCEF